MGVAESQCNGCTNEVQQGFEVVSHLDRRFTPQYFRSRCRAGRLAAKNCGPLHCTQSRGAGYKAYEEPEWLSVSFSALSPADRNLKLQEIVRAFVLRASAGVPCDVVDSCTGFSWHAEYVVDARLQGLQININSETQWNCRFADIENVALWREDFREGQAMLPDSLRNSIPLENLHQLVIIEQKDGRRICLLEEEPALAEETRVAVGILSLYMRERSAAHHAHQPASKVDLFVEI